MANVIREDVVQVSWDIDNGGISQLNNEIDQLRAGVTGNIDKGLTDIAGGFDDLKKAAGGDFGDGLEELKKTTKSTNNELGDTSTEADKATEALKDMGKVSFGKLTAGLDKVSNAIGNATKKALKLTAKGIVAGAAGVGALAGASVSAYAEYEQLVGGVETLFKDSAGIVQQYANNAFKTAGISANKYMDTVTSFSASMISSVGGDTKKAAELSNMALTDMSDNANKMGTDMETLIGTYQSLAKGNYAMLDNLKLGYGGTKAEMERLIKDAAKLDKTVKVGDMSFGNMAKAIHAVQTNLGITGTTAKEASTTISGSFSQMKASWQNLLPALIQGGDNFDQCLSDLIGSAKTFGKNVMPAIGKALEGVGDLITEMAPVIAKEAPKLVKTVLPPLLSAAGTIVGSLIAELPAIVSALIPAIKQAAAEIIKALYEGITGKKMSGDTFSSITSAIDKVVSVAQKAAPVIIGLALAFKGFKVVQGVVSSVQKFATGIANIATKVSGGLASKLTATSVGMKSTGTASATSATQVSTAATAFLKMGVAILAIGGGILLAAAGFALLTQSAIALANSGWGAIGVMIGMVAAIALLAWGASFLGTALTAGAVGFIAFGAAVLMVGAGFALIGVGALLAAMGLNLIALALPPLISYGIQGAFTIVTLGMSLVIFALQATVAAVALIALSIALIAVSIPLLAIVLSMTILTALFAILPMLLMLTNTMFMLMNIQIMLITVSVVMLIPMVIMFTTAMLTLTVALIALAIPLAAMAIAFAALAVEFVILAPLSVVLAAAIGTMGVAFGIMQKAVPTVAKALPKLVSPFLKLPVPAAALAVALVPLAAAFVAFAAAALLALAAVTGLTVMFAALALALTIINIQFMIMSLMFALVAMNTAAFVMALTPLPLLFAMLVPAILAFTMIVVPLALLFATLAIGAVAFALSMTVLSVVMVLVNALMLVFSMTMMLLPTTLLMSAMSLMIMNMQLTMLTMILTILTPLLLIFTPALLAMTVALLAIVAPLTIATAMFAVLMASFVILAPLATLLAAALAIMAPAFKSMSSSIPKVSSTIGSLAGKFTKLIAPAGLLAAALTPLAAVFVLLTASAVALLATMVGLATTTAMLVTTFTLLLMLSKALIVPFKTLGMAAVQLAFQFPLLAAAMMRLIAPLTIVSGHFVKFASAATITSVAAMIIVMAFANIATAGGAASVSLGMLVVNIRLLQAAINGCAMMFNTSFAMMVQAVKKGGSKMVNSLTLTLMQIRLLLMSANLSTAGMQLMNGLIRGMNSKKAAAVATARAIALAINKEFDKIQDIHSPSGVWEDKGEFLIKGGIKGIQNMLPKFQSMVQTVGEAAIPYTGNYTPENSTYSYSRSNNTENNTYSPQFNLTIGGSAQDRATERKVKQWITDAMDDVFDSLSRKSPRVQEV